MTTSTATRQRHARARAAGPQARCSKCNESKPTAAFSCRYGDGIQDWCRDCSAAYQRRRQNRQPALIKPGRNRKLDYGLTLSQYYALLEDQGFCCAACSDELDLGKGTHVDHCHETGRVRGVLCRWCNQAFGFCKDNPARVERLLAYAQRTTEGTV